MKLGNIEHDVDYKAKTVSTEHDLGQGVDDLRLSALASIEELHQFFIKNKDLAIGLNWHFEAMTKDLESCINILRNKI